MDATDGYKLDYTAPAPHDEAVQNYIDIWLQGDQNPDFIWGRSVEEFGFSSRTYPGGDGWSQGPGMVALYHGPNGYHEWAGTTPTEALASKYTLADGTDRLIGIILIMPLIHMSIVSLVSMRLSFMMGRHGSRVPMM